MNNEMENEIWKKYPEYPLIEGSSIGRVRTLDRRVLCGNHIQFVKGHILNRYHDKDGYLFVNFRVNGKTVNMKVHRIIASCFLQNPDDLSQVNHKNCVRDDNRIENIEWCSPEYNQRYRDKFGVSHKEVAKALCRLVYAVKLTNFETICFESQHEASRELRIAQGDIWRVIAGQNKQAGGYWFTDNKDKIAKEKILEIKASIYFKGGVIAVNLKKLEVLYFKSYAEAGRLLGFDANSIGDVIAGRQKTAHGYWFTRFDNCAVKATRNKFGDKVAANVEKIRAVMVA